MLRCPIPHASCADRTTPSACFLCPTPRNAVWPTRPPVRARARTCAAIADDHLHVGQRVPAAGCGQQLGP
eukprot:190016-Chlamydomonas_euryale.AAC.3